MTKNQVKEGFCYWSENIYSPTGRKNEKAEIMRSIYAYLYDHPEIYKKLPNDILEADEILWNMYLGGDIELDGEGFVKEFKKYSVKNITIEDIKKVIKPHNLGYRELSILRSSHPYIEYKNGVVVVKSDKGSFEIAWDIPHYERGTIIGSIERKNKFPDIKENLIKHNSLSKIAGKPTLIDIPSLIDFRYLPEDTELVFDSSTEEYKMLERMDEEEWEFYLDEHSRYGVIIEYDVVEDVYIVYS